MSEDVFTDMLEDEIEPAQPCPRCGRCGFIEDADMNLAGVCPECKGMGTAKITGGALQRADGSWEMILPSKQKEWRVMRDEEDESELVNADWIVVDEAGEIVANVHGRTVGDCITNADLIAMAPAMRRALHRIAHCDDTRTVGEDATSQIEKRLSEAIGIAEAALGYISPCQPPTD